MSVIVVIRNNGVSTIINGPITKAKLYRIKKAVSARPRPIKSAWNDDSLKYLVENYNSVSKFKLAMQMSKKFNKKFTKNMVVAKYNYIKKGVVNV